ncbi:glycosyltransferase family 2 protein [Adhaeretor mobilis]|uniref:Undecaprenyl-phosphate 4-deoxy-4-formamido-L-arabinose transferase n=1 Tax=Adhaeretor mobilis TaxID=1930276 RepID=A0A517MR99_9BACT|nr:glycosyltransferase family 2 protein [Adhaeretor mobilis]QDS97327.1 Undecaprenyl-phosphate 4-deoxy-4-formamido-L-arabinose transferase [Adhaeretor mobilis]
MKTANTKTTDTTSVSGQLSGAPYLDGVKLDQSHVDRIEATFEIAEQTLEVVREMDAAPPVEARKKTDLSVSVVIPVYNERNTVVEIVRRVQAVGIHKEIILVDDFSMDGTRKILLELEREPDIHVILHGYNRGKGAALKTAFAQVTGDVVMIQDADLEYNPNDLPRLLEAVQAGADVVYGSRFLENAAENDPSRLHRFGNWALTTASNYITGQQLTDMETCYKVFRREALERVSIEQERFGFEPEITAKLSQLGYKIEEHPISYNSRGYDAGKKIGIGDALSALFCIAKYRK